MLQNGWGGLIHAGANGCRSNIAAPGHVVLWWFPVASARKASTKEGGNEKGPASLLGLGHFLVALQGFEPRTCGL